LWTNSQLSLAIGKKGQNVRLAAKLLGWKIDIKSEEEKRQEVQNAIELLSTGAPVFGADRTRPRRGDGGCPGEGRHRHGGEAGQHDAEQLEALEGIDGEVVGRIQQAINSFYGQEYAEEPEPLAESVALPESAAEADQQAVETSSDNMVESAGPAIEQENTGWPGH